MPPGHFHKDHDVKNTQSLYRCLQVQAKQSLHRLLYDKSAKVDVQKTQEQQAPRGFRGNADGSAVFDGQILALGTAILAKVPKEKGQTDPHGERLGLT